MALPEARIRVGEASVASRSRVRIWAIFAIIAGVPLLLAALNGRATVGS